MARNSGLAIKQFAIAKFSSNERSKIHSIKFTRYNVHESSAFIVVNTHDHASPLLCIHHVSTFYNDLVRVFREFYNEECTLCLCFLTILIITCFFLYLEDYYSILIKLLNKLNQTKYLSLNSFTIVPFSSLQFSYF